MLAFLTAIRKVKPKNSTGSNPVLTTTAGEVYYPLK